MALTTQQNGTTVGGVDNQARASWWNDYKDVLTGVMHDQPITLNYRPGAVTQPTLTLKGDGQNALLKGYDTDNTTVVATLDHSGNLTVSGNATVGGASGGQFGYTSPAVFYNTPFSGATALGHAFGTWDGSASHVPFSIGGQFNAAKAYVDNSGNFNTTSGITASGNATIGGFMLLGTAVGGSQTQLFYSSGINAVQLSTPQAGATALGIAFGTWTGSTGKIPFSIGGQFNGAPSYLDNNGNLVISGSIKGFGNASVFVSGGGLTGKFTAQSTAPASPVLGDLWLDLSTPL